MNHDECTLVYVSKTANFNNSSCALIGCLHHANLEACLVADFPQTGKVALRIDSMHVYFNAD